MMAIAENCENAKTCNKKRACLGSLTKFELLLIVLCLVLFAALLGVCIYWLVVIEGYKYFLSGASHWNHEDAQFPRSINDSSLWSQMKNQDAVCTSRECVMIAALMAGNLDEMVDPCDDFYEFACGNYGLDRDLQPHHPSRFTMGDMNSRVNKKIKSILGTTINAKDKSWNKLSKMLYQKCMDEAKLQQTGVDAVHRLLDMFGGWPVLKGTAWKAWPHSWERQLALMLRRIGYNAIVIEFSVSHDPRNSSRNIIELDQPKWGVGSRWPYLSGPDDPMMQNYTELMIQIAVKLGADPYLAEKEMKEAMELETKLVNFSADEQIRRDPDHVYNAFQLDQIGELFPFINLREYLETILEEITALHGNDTVNVREVEYLQGIQHVLYGTNKRVIANYMMWRLVHSIQWLLPNQLRDLFNNFRANQTGMSTGSERWEECVQITTVALDMPVGQLFVEHFFEKEKAMAKLTHYLKQTFIRQLRSLDWMDDMTKRRAIEKANYIQYKNGYPQYLFNDTWMQENWGYMESNASEPLLDLLVRIKGERVRDEARRFKLPVDRGLWFNSPAVVDAYYAPNLNEMIFPAGIMQFPFLTLNVPNYVTYAMAGAVVGHEVSHAFDDQGGRYDELGNLNNWWDEETERKFYDKTECFIRQYESVKVDVADVYLNGRLTLGENIADNGGIKTAYAAYKSWYTNSSTLEPSLPGLQNFTKEQLFFLAYANNWCSVIRDKHYAQLVLYDVHAPNKYRTLIPLQNRPEFSSAYNCPPGSPMNPRQKCEIW